MTTVAGPRLFRVQEYSGWKSSGMIFRICPQPQEVFCHGGVGWQHLHRRRCGVVAVGLDPHGQLRWFRVQEDSAIKAPMKVLTVFYWKVLRSKHPTLLQGEGGTVKGSVLV